MRSYWPTSASSFSDISLAWGYGFWGPHPQPPLHEWRGGEEFDGRNGGRLVSVWFGDLTPQPPLHEWRGGEEFDGRNGGRLDRGGEEFDGRNGGRLDRGGEEFDGRNGGRLVSGARTLISPFGE